MDPCLICKNTMRGNFRCNKPDHRDQGIPQLLNKTATGTKWCKNLLAIVVYNKSWREKDVWEFVLGGMELRTPKEGLKVIPLKQNLH